MIYSLLHADFLSALRFNALALVAVAFLFVAYVVWTYGRVVGRTSLGLAAQPVGRRCDDGSRHHVVRGAQPAVRAVHGIARVIHQTYCPSA